MKHYLKTGDVVIGNLVDFPVGNNGDAVLYQADDWNDFSGQDRGKLIDKVSDL